MAWMEGAAADLRWAVRGLRKRPTFTAVAVLTLALGIGANSAIFTLVNAQFLAALPYKDPGSLVLLWETDHNSLNANTVAPGNYFAWKEGATSFSGMAAFNVNTATLSGDGGAERVAASVVTPDFFTVLGVKPELGGTFPSDASGEADGDLVLLSHALWVRRYGADPTIVGRSIHVDGRAHLVVGVMPAGFRQPERELAWQDPQIWRPLLLRGVHDNFGGRSLRTVARLAPGVTLPRARQEMDAFAVRMARAHPREDAGRSILVKDLDTYVTGDARPILLLLLVAGAAVFLIVCANVANLTLARGQDRRQEFAVRAALGSGRGRLLRQIIVESVVLAGVGAAVGTLSVVAGQGVLERLQERYFTGLVALSVDVRVVTFTVLATLVGGVLFALPLARYASRVGMRAAMEDGGDRGVTRSGLEATRNLLVMGQVAMATTLLVLAVLLSRSFDRLVNVPPGFQPSGRVTFSVSAPRSRYPDRDGYVSYLREVEREVAAVPGVEAVAATSDLPFTSENDWWTFGIEGQPWDAATAPRADFHVTQPAYFGLMGIPVLEGHLPEASWDVSGDTVVVVNRHMARMIAPEGGVLGRVVVLHEAQGLVRLRVVAVVGDVLDGGFAAEPKPTFYLPYGTWADRGMSVVVRVRGQSRAVMGALREAVARVDPDIPAAGLRTLDDLVGDTVSRPRAASLMGGVFALVAILVAVTGIYGVLSYSVRSRTREMGIRSALGASGGALVRMVMEDSGRLVALGLLVGLAGALAAASALSSLLFGVHPWDPVSYVGAALVLTTVASLAAWLPARRAVRIDPREALRAP